MNRHLHIIIHSLFLSVLFSCGHSSQPSKLGTVSSGVGSGGIYLALGNPINDGRSPVFVAVEVVGVQNVVICSGDAPSCTTSPHIDVACSPSANFPQTQARRFFECGLLDLSGVSFFTILAANAANQVVGYQQVNFQLGSSQSTTNQVLSQEQEIPLKSPQGNVSKISDVFLKDYLVIDLSSLYCSNCMTLAEQHNSDPVFTGYFNSGRCSFAALIPEQEVPGWQQKFGPTTFMGKNVYGRSVDHKEVGRRFGAVVNLMPTMLIIDRSGRVVDSQENGLPSQLSALCTGTASNQGVNQTNQGGLGGTSPQYNPYQDNNYQDPYANPYNYYNQGGCNTGG